MKILWLTSWYPNKYDQFTGDFIQRHAIATSAYAEIEIIHVQFVPAHLQKEVCIIETNKLQRFFETIVYLKQEPVGDMFNKLVNQLRYEKFYKKSISTYILKNGQPDLVHVHIPVKAGDLALWLKKKYGTIFLVSEHYGIYNNEAPDNFNTRSAWYRLLTKKIIAEARMLLVVSENLGKAISSMVAKKVFQVVYNVVDTNVFFKKPSHSTNEYWFAHASLMDPNKNPDGILRAFANAKKLNPNIYLRMVGSAPASAIRLSEQLGLTGSVRFTGMLPQPEVAGQLHESDAFILFSHYENMPCSIEEALCCGLPVIATNVGGIPEIIDASNGILISPEDEEALTDAMLNMAGGKLTFNRDTIAAKAADSFSYDVIGKEIAALYDNAIKK